MLPPLRPYQETAVSRALEALRNRPILVLPTGGGKTICATSIVHRRGGRVLWLAHRRELIGQGARTLAGMGLHVGQILAGVEPDDTAPVQVASVQTLLRRPVPQADLVVIDECHHATKDGGYATVLAKYPDAEVLGLTATPFRLDGRGLGEAGFREILVGATVQQLVDLDVLHAPKVYAPGSPNLRGVKKTAGDYNLHQVEQLVDRAPLHGDVVTTWKQRADGRRTVCFAVTIAHSEHLRDAFRAAGIRAEHIDAKTGLSEREDVLGRLAAGEIHVMCNVGIVTEGWDLPALECASIARPTASLGLHLQCIGRVVRAAPGKEGALVLDHAGNTARHGLITDPIVYSLEGRVAKAEIRNGIVLCPQCKHATRGRMETCPACGHVRPVEKVEIPKAAAGELRETTGRIYPAFVEQQRFYERVIMAADRRRAPNPEASAAAAFHSHFGFWPDIVAGRLVNPAEASEEDLGRLRLRWRQLGANKGWVGGRLTSFITYCEGNFRQRGMQARAAASQLDLTAPPKGECTCFQGHPPCSWCERSEALDEVPF